MAMEFIDESESFGYGFECGRIWEQLKTTLPIQQHVHAANASQIIMMCEHYNRQFELKEMGEGWLHLLVK